MKIKCQCGRIRQTGQACPSCGKGKRGHRLHAAARGYDYKWQKYRKLFLANNPLCVHCEAKGETEPATEVDHKERPTSKEDPLFWDMANHQGLCKPCHIEKTKKERAKA